MNASETTTAPAVWALAAAVAAAGWPERPAPPAPPCEAPRLTAPAVPGSNWVDVRCGGSGNPPSGAAGLLFGIPLDLGRAGQADLEALPGIGPQRAAAILEAREERPFCAPRDLTRVPGIGPRTAERLRGWVQGDARRCGARRGSGAGR